MTEPQRSERRMRRYLLSKWVHGFACGVCFALWGMTLALGIADGDWSLWPTPAFLTFIVATAYPTRTQFLIGEAACQK